MTYQQKLITWIVNHPKRLLVFTLIIVMVFAVGLKNLSISNDFRVYLSKDNPQLLAFESFENDYVKSDSATFIITAKEGDIFTQNGLQLIQELTNEAWLIDSAYRVSSLSNYQYTQAIGDEISTDYLVRDDLSTRFSEQQLDTIRQRALQEKRLVHSLLTADGQLSAILINLQLDKNKPNASIVITQQMEALSHQYRLAYPQFQIDNGGSTAFNATLAKAVENDITTLLPISYVIIFLGLLFFLRSLLATFSIFLLISICLISTFGFFGWTNPVLTPIAGFAPSILLSIMVADSVHILTTYFYQRNIGSDQKQAVIESLNLNMMPVLVTSLTTMIGFLTLNFSSSPPYQDLGNMVAFGVLMALIFSLFFLPCLMILLPLKPPLKSSLKCSLKSSQSAQNTDLFTQLSQFVIFQKKRLLIVVSFLVILLAYFIPNNKLTDNWAGYFDDSFTIVKLVKRIDGYLTGINTLEYSFESNTEKGIFDPQYLHQLDQFEQWYRTQDKIVSVTALSRLMKELNQSMYGDDEKQFKIPENSDLAAQYLLFYEIGLPQGMGLNNLVNIHKTASRFSVSMSNAGSAELLALDKKAQVWLKENAPAIKTSTATGLGIVFAHIAQRNITSLLIGTFIALVGISILLMVILKSVKYGLISLVPNIVPALMAYGFWGLTYGYVDISLSIVACSTLGIVVDDTVHFLHKYIAARKKGKNNIEAVKESFSRVGIALLTTSVVLACGFLILSFSHMNTSATIGLLMATTLIFALIVDFLLLPPLLLYFDKSEKVEKIL
jgi:predicted RND superfamily exporter protein